MGCMIFFIKTKNHTFLSLRLLFSLVAPKFKPNTNKIKDLIPSKSFSIISVSKANNMPTKPEVSEEAEKNAKDNVTKMNDFTSETDRLKKLLEEDFNEDDLFNGAEDPDNCTI
jgi:hypothetical protein